METALFDFRPGEWKLVYKDEVEIRPGERLYAVALVDTPPFPGESHKEGNALALIVAAKYETIATPDAVLWGWVHIGPDTKEEIGEWITEALADDLEIGRWYYMVVTPFINCTQDRAISALAHPTPPRSQ